MFSWTLAKAKWEWRYSRLMLWHVTLCFVLLTNPAVIFHTSMLLLITNHKLVAPWTCWVWGQRNLAKLYLDVLHHSWLWLWADALMSHRCWPNAARASFAPPGPTLTDGGGSNQTRMIRRTFRQEKYCTVLQTLNNTWPFFPFFFIKHFLTNITIIWTISMFSSLSRLNNRRRLHGFHASCTAATEHNQPAEAIRSLICAPSHALVFHCWIFLYR